MITEEKYTGIKKLILNNIDMCHETVTDRQGKETRAVLSDSFEELIDYIYMDIIDLIKIHDELKNL